MEVIKWAKKNLDIDPQKIGLWGASEDVSFSILVSPAINWIEQGKYYTEKSMANAGATKKEISQRIKQTKS
ncbi:hypothetical protein AAIE21_26715 [Paenibacillus sp. 102]|uniref:hypothetical protein n=1 Tax=Paenibacillus sp. 102 TaxID=3120823 RepID=UPI0031BBA38A